MRFEPSIMYGPEATRKGPSPPLCPVAAPKGAVGSVGLGGIGAVNGIAKR